MISRFWNWANTSPGNPESVITANMGQSQSQRLKTYLITLYYYFDHVNVHFPSNDNKTMKGIFR